MFKYILSIALIASFSPALFAHELDGVQGSAPKGLIIRESAGGKREVFKSTQEIDLRDPEQAKAAIAKAVKNSKNLIKTVKAGGSELDRSTSSESWYYWNNWGGYGCNWYGANYFYAPVYSYVYPTYSYYYYTPYYPTCYNNYSWSFNFFGGCHGGGW
jgi:hypothetical protein